MKKVTVEIITIFLLSILFLTIVNNIQCDEIWNYGFAYNIAKGLIPYRDFNMIITPLFPIVSAIILKIFGINYITYLIFNSIIYTIIYIFMKKTSPTAYFIIFYLFLVFQFPSYNILCLLFLYLLIIQERQEKQNDILIGIILGLTICTKQNIGLFLCLPTIIYIRSITKLLKRILGAIIPVSIMIIYLLITKSLFSFFDYAILGIQEFANNNTKIHFSFLILTIGAIIYLIYQYIKTKKVEYLYLISFQIISYPIFDQNHAIIGLIPVLGYILNNLRINKKITKIAITLVTILILSFNAIETFSAKYNFYDGLDSYKYRKISKNITDGIKLTGKYIKEQPGKVYILNNNAYIIKIANNLPIDKYDLLNSGNMGVGGIKQIIKELDNTCQSTKCTMLINYNEVKYEVKTQYSHELYEYIIKNYQQQEIIAGLTAYKNF